MEDIIDIIVTETTNLIEITSQPTDEIIDVNIIDNREDVTLNVTPTLVEININSLTGNFGILWGEIEGTLSNQTDLQNALNLKADLVDGKVPSSQLPSYVDDVVEVANYAALPVTGEVGKIYITLDTNYIYRWTGSVYVEIKDSSAVWGAITGTLSNQTDLQNALNLKANDNAVVHLAGAETITGAKTFSSAVTAPNFILSGGTGNTGLYYGHTDRVVLANYTAGGIDFEVNGGSIVATLFPSGNYGLGITLDAGYKLDVNGTTRISGALSGTSASFSSSITASSIIKSGGTSSQFLKADGSVDSSTYATTSQLHNPVTIGTANGLSLSTQVLSLGLASSSTNGALSSTDWTTFNNKQAALSGTGFVKISGTTISYDNSTYLTTSSAASTYVPYTGANSAVNLGAYDLTVNGIKIGRGAGSISDNTVVGASALTSNTTGSSNTAIGFSALGANTIAGGNTAIGTYALSANISGGTNIAIGYSAGSSITTGSNNVIIGGYAGTSAMSGNVILSDGGGNIRFQYNGTNTLLGQSGNVLINTTTDSGYKLDVNGTGRFSGRILINSTTNYSALQNANTSGNIYWGIDSSTGGDFTGVSYARFIYSEGAYPLITYVNGAERMRIASTGAATFSSSVTATQFITGGSPSNTAGFTNSFYAESNIPSITLSNTGTNTGKFTIGVTNGNFGIWNNATSTYPIFVNSSNNVGIGTTSPTGLLHLYGSDPAFRIQSSTTGNMQMGQWDGTYNRIQGSGRDFILINTDATNMLFSTNSTERMRITSGGNVGIGTTSPASKLHIEGTGTGAWLTINRTDSGTNLVDYTQSGTRLGYIGYIGSELWINNATASDISIRTSGSERMRITSGGDLLINKTSLSAGSVGVEFERNSTSRMTVDGGTVLLLNRLTSDGTIADFRRSTTQVGSISVTTVMTSYNVTSDYRLKEDLKPINGLDIVNKIKVYDYKWKADNSRMDGVLAHELQEVLPYAVIGIKDGEQMQQVDYSKIVPVMVQAIKDLKAELDTLKNK